MTPIKLAPAAAAVNSSPERWGKSTTRTPTNPMTTDLRLRCQCRNRDSNPPPGTERIDLLDRVLFFTLVCACGFGDLTIWLDHAERRRNRCIDQHWGSRRRRTHFTHQKLPLCVSLVGRSI